VTKQRLARPRLAQRGFRGAAMAVIVTALPTLMLPACATAVAAGHTAVPPAEGPHVLVSDQVIARMPASSVRAELDSARIAPGAPALGGSHVRYGITVYRVAYRTTDALGRTTIASGVVAFPRDGGRDLRVVEYDHGTTADKVDVPSSFGLDAAGDGIEGRWSAELFASAGFATAEPDYPGMGQGPGRPQYMVAGSEVSASLDLLAATAQIAAGRGARLDRGVLMTGFSQGGAAAMAVGRALQDHAEPGFGLQALAPVSGPYDLAGAQVPGIFDDQVDPAMATYLVGYTLTAWNPIYDLYAAPSQAFRRPYASTVEALFDGSHSDQDVARSLPATIQQLLTARFLRLLRHPAGQLRRALLLNGTCAGWIPHAPTRLYAAAGDRTVPQANAEHCQRAISQGSRRVPLIELGAVDHDVSDFIALPQILTWFRQWLRQ
jgi:hypothetical protein